MTFFVKRWKHKTIDAGSYVIDGICKGLGGFMHAADFSKGIIGANGIVGAGLSI